MGYAHIQQERLGALACDGRLSSRETVSIELLSTLTGRGAKRVRSCGQVAAAVARRASGTNCERVHTGDGAFAVGPGDLHEWDPCQRRGNLGVQLEEEVKERAALRAACVSPFRVQLTQDSGSGPADAGLRFGSS